MVRSTPSKNNYNTSPSSAPAHPSEETYTPSSTPQRHQTSQKQVLRRNSASVDEDTDRAIVEYRVRSRLRKFEDVCNERTDIFGNPGSRQRKKVENRNQYLRTLESRNPQAFRSLVNKYGIVQDQHDHRPPEVVPSTFTPLLTKTFPVTPPIKKRVTEPPLTMSYPEDLSDQCERWLLCVCPYCYSYPLLTQQHMLSLSSDVL